MKSIECIVAGKVQGVGYRFFIYHLAVQLSLKGWVKNNSDGSVQIMVQGNIDIVETFLHHAKQGPVHAKVEQIITSEVFINECNEFKIRM